MRLSVCIVGFAAALLISSSTQAQSRGFAFLFASQTSRSLFGTKCSRNQLCFGSANG
jgi:hypothetical protein